MTLFASINGRRATSATLHVPYSGVWVADLELDDAVTLAGAVKVKFGALELLGTVYAPRSGRFGSGTSVRVLAGAAGWIKQVPAKHYHNDAGEKLATIARDTAIAVGETFDVTGLDGRVGVDFARQRGAASRVLEQLFPSTPWWVDYQGVTRAGVRAQVEPARGAYELLDFDRRNKVATLAVDDPGAVLVGSVLRSRLDRPLVVRQLDVEVGAKAVRVEAWGVEEA